MGISPSIQSNTCPYCGRAMSEGFIVVGGRNFMFWVEDVEAKLLTMDGSNARLLESKLTGLKCDACELAVLDIRDSIEAKYADVPRTKCPHCGAFYLLREDMLDENGMITCQNCARKYKDKSALYYSQDD
ncbi:MAG: PF20097 family protein [Promethearchaeota archaeon]